MHLPVIIPKLLIGMIAIPILCLPLWPRGRKILQSLSRKLLWGLCAMTAVAALAVIVDGKGDPYKAFAGFLMGIFVVYTAFVARSLRAKNKNALCNARKV